MTDSKHNGPDEALWRRAAPEAEAGPAPDPGLIAAWIEGRLGDAERAAVERRLAASPNWLEAATLARTATECADGEDVPLSVVARARALAPGAVPVQQPRISVLQLLASRWLEVVATTGAVVAAGLLGFMLGQSTIEDFARTEATLVTELPEELDYILASNWDGAPTMTIPDWEERR